MRQGQNHLLPLYHLYVLCIWNVKETWGLTTVPASGGDESRGELHREP
jgi:hypothetical protein